MRLRATILAMGLMAVPLGAVQAADVAAPDDAAIAKHWEMLNQYCTDCHNYQDWAGGVAFDTMQPDSAYKHADVWEKAIRKLQGSLMPPPGKKRPDEAALKDFVSSMENYLDAAADKEGPQPGHVAIHRLNREEYANAIQDILAFKVDAEALLPPDTKSEGFDNVADVLQVSPTFLEQYIAAARDISIQAVGQAAPEPDLVSFEAPSLATQYRHVEGLPLGTRGGFAVDHYFPADGDYDFSVEIASQEGSLQRSYPTWWLESQHRFLLTIDGQEVYTTELGGHDDAQAVDRTQTPAITAIQDRFKNIRVHVKAGTHTIGVSFVARSFGESDRIVDQLSPGEGMDNIPVVVRFKTLGPFNPNGLVETASRRKIFTCHPEAAADERPCAEEIMSSLARQAYRRPVTHADMQALMGFYDAGRQQGGFETGVQKAIMAMLASTKFLYRTEPVPADAKPGEVYALSDLELASRLAYFLWSRGPDDQLLDVAQSGKLRDPKVLEAEVRRMLKDGRAEALVTNFAFQWLRVADVNAIDPDPRMFPDFDPDLRAAFTEELKLFINSVLRSDDSVLDLLNSKYTFVNERLARHYGIDSVRGSQFRKVALTDDRRWGILGKGGILLLTSYPNRTSPVLRGAYVLEKLFGTPPASPPPNVETNLDVKPGEAVTTLRQRLEVHRADPSCNQCHGVIDPIGLALENFNAIGQWRDIDRFASSPIDAHGQLASGEPVTGPIDLRNALVSRPEQFVQTVTENLMVYALGRGLDYQDMPKVREIVQAAAKDNYRFRSLVMGIVNSPQFQMKELPVAEAHENGQKQASLQN